MYWISPLACLAAAGPVSELWSRRGLVLGCDSDRNVDKGRRLITSGHLTQWPGPRVTTLILCHWLQIYKQRTLSSTATSAGMSPGQAGLIENIALRTCPLAQPQTLTKRSLRVQIIHWIEAINYQILYKPSNYPRWYNPPINQDRERRSPDQISAQARATVAGLLPADRWVNTLMEIIS